MARADKKAFTLRAEYEDDFAGASMAIGDGDTLNIGDRLDEGKGTIRTSDPEEIAALREHPALKEGEAEDNPSPSSGGKS